MSLTTPAGCLGGARRRSHRIYRWSRLHPLLPAQLPQQPRTGRRQSRLTLRSETPSTCAVSSTLNPPKKRSSTTRALRSSIADSAVRASSTATNSDSRLMEGRASSNVTRNASLPACPRSSRGPPRSGYGASLERNSEEVGTILPTHVAGIDQAKICLVHECSCLQRVLAVLTSQCAGARFSSVHR